MCKPHLNSFPIKTKLKAETHKFDQTDYFNVMFNLY